MKFLDVERYTYLEEKHRDYLEELKAYVQKSEYLPDYHIYPPCGLLNDPNGLSWFGGNYHVFYQWFPFGPSHGMKHWAHVISKDMVHWEWSEEMLIPNQEYEKNGCYSGNALVKEDKVYLYYTANYKTEQGKIPKQAVAIMDKDGHITKYEHNPIIDGAPEGMSGEIRDPYVFEKNGTYYMLLGAKDIEGKGQLLLYKGENPFEWEYQGIINTGFKDLGTMVECPAFLNISGKDVLFLSPIGFPREKERFCNRFPSIYLIGNLDVEKLEFRTEHWDEIDGGFDFYAPQMFYGENKEPMMFGWFGCGEQSLPTDSEMWRHGLTLPRKLVVKDGALYTEPVQTCSYAFGQEIDLDENTEISPDKKTWRAKIHVSSGKKSVTIGDEKDCYKIILDTKQGKAILDRSGLKEAVDPDYGETRSCTLQQGNEITAEIYQDNSFLEIYINGGQKVMSARVFQKSQQIVCRTEE